jgi:hypothetical protein
MAALIETEDQLWPPGMCLAMFHVLPQPVPRLTLFLGHGYVLPQLCACKWRISVAASEVRGVGKSPPITASQLETDRILETCISHC